MAADQPIRRTNAPLSNACLPSAHQQTQTNWIPDEINQTKPDPHIRTDHLHAGHCSISRFLLPKPDRPNHAHILAAHSFDPLHQPGNSLDVTDRHCTGGWTDDDTGQRAR